MLREEISDPAAGDRSFDYGYDLVGNRLFREDSLLGRTDYLFDDNHRLTQTTENETITNFAYDPNGSITQRGNTTYDWVNDGENRLVGVNDGTTQVRYEYNGFGERVASVVDGVQTNYLVDSSLVLPQVRLEYDQAGSVTTEYFRGLGLVSTDDTDGQTFFHSDGLGSTRVLTDATGGLTDRFNYDAYGVLLPDSVGATEETPFLFAGEQRDGATGLDYLRARYYDTDLGRFISKDPFSGTLGDPFTQHDYQYAHANPVNNTDPTGYFSITRVLTAVGVSTTLSSIGATAGYVGYGLVTGGISGDQDLRKDLGGPHPPAPSPQGEGE